MGGVEEPLSLSVMSREPLRMLQDPKPMPRESRKEGSLIRVGNVTGPEELDDLLLL